MYVRVLALSISVFLVGAGAWIALQKFTPEPPLQLAPVAGRPALPAEAFYIDDFRKELSPTWANYQLALRNEAVMEEVRKKLIAERGRSLISSEKATRPKTLVDDPFYSFIVRQAPKAQIVLFRKGKYGRMAAVRAADGRVRMIFDYRDFAKAWLSFRSAGDRKLREDHEGGYFTVDVAADETLVTVIKNEPPQFTTIDVWRIDGVFADRERLVK